MNDTDNAVVKAVQLLNNSTVPNMASMRALSETPIANTNNISWVYALMPLWIYLIVQAIIGLIGIEWALSKYQRFIEVDEARDCNFPAFRRVDSPKYARWKYYPGALLLMPTRFLLLILDAIFLVVLIRILSIGHDYKQGPMPDGCRKSTIKCMFYIACSFYLWVCGMNTSITNVDNDYSYWLGPDYKKNYKPIRRTSTIVSNHCSWLDAVILLKTLIPAFTPSTEFESAPLLSTFIDAIDSIYIPRGGSPEARAAALKVITDRQDLIEEAGEYAPVLVFPEGGTTNGSHLIKFKKGAFVNEKRVTPVLLKYKLDESCSPEWGSGDLFPLILINLSWLCCMRCDLIIMSDFEPTEYLYRNFENQGSERWEIFAWALREAMAQQGDFRKCDMPLRCKVQYEDYMCMRKDNPTPLEIWNNYQ